MEFFVRKERCKYCAGELRDDKCTNPNCIACTEASTEKTTENKEGTDNA